MHIFKPIYCPASILQKSAWMVNLVIETPSFSLCKHCASQQLNE